MRLTTWNLRSCPAPLGERGRRITEMLAYDGVSITLLTEVHADWTSMARRRRCRRREWVTQDNTDSRVCFRRHLMTSLKGQMSTSPRRRLSAWCA